MTDAESHLQPAPELAAFDYALAIAKVGSLAFPFLGLGVTLFDLVTAPALGKRMNDWREELRLRLNELSEKVSGMTPEALSTSDAFVSAFAQATQAALKTHQKEKLDALRNAVLNVAVGKEPDRQQQFLAVLDRFSETDLLVLRFLNDPTHHFQESGHAATQRNHVDPRMLVNTFVAQAFPHLRQTSEDPSTSSFQFIELVLGNLVSSHLVTLGRYEETWIVPAFAITPGGGPIGKMTTQLGKDFLAFITKSDLGN